MTTPTTTINNRPVPQGLAEFLSRRMRDASAGMNCCLVGQIYSFNPTNQTAKVFITIQKVIKGAIPQPNTVGGSSDKIVNYPTLVNVPVMFLQGGSSYITLPIASGDTCLVLFCDRDIDTWLQTGQIAPPNSERVHDLNDAVAFVGIRNFQNPLSNYNPNIISVNDSTGERLTQAGFLQPYAGTSAPSGWLLCYGQSVSKTTYSVLFSVIGYTYGGSGDNFNIPDLRGRTIAGLDNMGGVDANVLTNTYNPNRNTLGGATGQEAHQLIIAELASHTHITNVDPVYEGNLDGGGATGVPAYTGGKTTLSTGGDVAHQNVQPTLMINWLIKL